MSNPYALFMNLLPKQIKTIGKIVRVETDGTVEVEAIRARSRTIIKGGTDAYNIDDYVFIIDGVIISKLPDTQEVIEYSVI